MKNLNLMWHDLKSRGRGTSVKNLDFKIQLFNDAILPKLVLLPIFLELKKRPSSYRDFLFLNPNFQKTEALYIFTWG